MRTAVTLASAGFAAVLLLLELVLRILPVSTATMTGYHLDPDVITYPPGHEWTTSTGWDLRNVQHLRANNWGFASERDFDPDPNAIALIGDSYVEAAMLNAADRPGRRLESLLGGKHPVFAFGSPGTALIDHAQRLRLASDRLQVRQVIIWLEQGDARRSLCGSGNVHSQCLDPQTLALRVERRPPPSAVQLWARHSALAQYLFGQLKFQPAVFWRVLFARSTPEEPKKGAAAPQAPAIGTLTPPARRVIDAVVARFFDDAAPYMPRRLLFVVDGRRAGPAAVSTSVDLERAYLILQLRASGADVIDLEPVFAQYATGSSRSLEVGPYDAHLNAVGVQLVMQQVAAWVQAQ